MSDSAIHMVDLEQRLTADTTGAVRDELRRHLEAELATVKRQAAAGLPPDEYAAAEKLQTALQAAITVVEKFSAARAQK